MEDALNIAGTWFWISLLVSAIIVKLRYRPSWKELLYSFVWIESFRISPVVSLVIWLGTVGVTFGIILYLHAQCP
jgi:hypothetical protein